MNETFIVEVGFNNSEKTEHGQTEDRNEENREEKNLLRSPSPSVVLVSSRKSASCAFYAAPRPPSLSSPPARGRSFSATPPSTPSSNGFLKRRKTHVRVFLGGEVLNEHVHRQYLEVLRGWK